MSLKSDNVEFVCGIVVAILKITTARDFSMSGINSGHHNLPTYEMAVAIFKMATKIQHCPISLKFDMLVDNDLRTLKIFYRSPFSKWPPCAVLWWPF
jgi:hypothetical protein